MSCFTYFWLENGTGNRYDVLKIPDPPFPYFLSSTIVEGIECVDKADTGIQELNLLLWSQIDTPVFFSKALMVVRQSILKKHPIK